VALKDQILTYLRGILFFCRDEGLQGLGIAGVSHHDLLFSKAAEPVPPAGPDDKDLNVTWEPRY
jgi:hypothetical protein